ncbi:MAG TPA: hypothetical protein VLN61_12355 [Pseudolabrys sp.]|nr:hypothetical protein [Pseudolabrys sp.]
MNRVWDYIGFAVGFTGLGYIVLWLFGSPEHLTLPPALRMIGVASAMLVPVRLFYARSPGGGMPRRARFPHGNLLPCFGHGGVSRRTHFARSSRAAISACAACWNSCISSSMTTFFHSLAHNFFPKKRFPLFGFMRDNDR